MLESKQSRAGSLSIDFNELGQVHGLVSASAECDPSPDKGNHCLSDPIPRGRNSPSH